MSATEGPNIINDSSLVLSLDCANRQSYPGSGTTWYDLAGTNNGTLVNGPTFNSANGGSLVFDGVNDYVSVADNASLNMTSGMTICCWVYFNTGSMGRRVIFTGKGDGNSTATTQYWLEKRDTNVIVFYASINLYDMGLSSGYSVIGDNWYYISGTYNGALQSVYVNGLLKSTSAATGPLTVTNTLFGVGKLGSFVNAPLFLDGKVPQVQIYNRALTSDEVLQNYNATKSRFLL